MKNIVNNLLELFIRARTMPLHNFCEFGGLTYNERLVLFFLYDLEKGGKISLSDVREKLKLAPSTVTPIIASLEAKKLVLRNIDKIDRRNIFLELTKEGIEYTNLAHEKLSKKMEAYINYMGIEDTNELVRLLTKTTDYMIERRNEENEKSI